MNKIRWRYVAALAAGMLFILCFGAALHSMGQLSKGKEDFIFLFEAQNTAKALADKSDVCDISAEIQVGEGVSLIIVKDTHSLNYQNVVNYFQSNDGYIDAGLLKWMLQLGFVIFTVGIALLFYVKLQGKGWHFTALPIWLLFLKSVPVQADFPVWVLPGKWSDFEGWKELFAQIGKQLFSLLRYKELSLVGKYCRGAFTGWGCLVLSFILVILYYRCIRRLHYNFFVHIIMTAIALIWYIKIADTGMKGLIYFFPCCMLTQYLAYMNET